MNYYDSVYGSRDAVTMDKRTSYDTGEQIYVITCHDSDKKLLDLIQSVRAAGNCGHSFEIVIDPDSDGKKSVFWDGDGSDKIHTITSQMAEMDLRKVLLANIDSIKRIARGAIPDKDEPDDKPDDPIEALKKIECTCDALTDGNSIDFGHGIKNALEQLIKNAKGYIKNCDVPPNPRWTPKEDFEHLLWCLKHYYEQMVESQLNDKPIKGKESLTSDGATMDESALKVGSKVKIRDHIRCPESGKTGIIAGFVKSIPLMVLIKFEDGHTIEVRPESFIDGYEKTKQMVSIG